MTIIIILVICSKAMRREEIQLEKVCREMRDGMLGESTEDLYPAIEQRRNFQRKQKWPDIECIFSGRICIFSKPTKSQCKKKIEMLNMFLPIIS